MQGAGTSIVLQDCLSYTSLHLCATLIFGKMFPHASCQRSVSFDVNGNLVLCCQHVDCDNINMVRLVKKRGVPVQNGTPPSEARTPHVLNISIRWLRLGKKTTWLWLGQTLHIGLHNLFLFVTTVVKFDAKLTGTPKGAFSIQIRNALAGDGPFSIECRWQILRSSPRTKRCGLQLIL